MKSYVRFMDTDSVKIKPHAPGYQIKRVFEKVLLGTFPRANPDFHDEYDNVTEWWFEVNENGKVSREIGLNKDGAPVVGAPVGNNLGIFTDEEEAPTALGESIDPEDFECAWKKVAT